MILSHDIDIFFSNDDKDRFLTGTNLATYIKERYANRLLAGSIVMLCPPRTDRMFMLQLASDIVMNRVTDATFVSWIPGSLYDIEMHKPIETMGYTPRFGSVRLPTKAYWERYNSKFNTV